MKIAVVLFVTLAVASGASTGGSLVEQTRPLFDQLAVQAAVSTSAFTRAHGQKGVGDVVNNIVSAVVAQAQALVDHIQATFQVVNGHAVQLSAKVKAQIHSAIAALQQAANIAHGTALTSITNLITCLQNLLGADAQVVDARRMVTRLNLRELLQNAIQNAVTELASNEFVQSLLTELAPYMQGAGSTVDQLTQLLLGNGKLNRAAPRGLSQIIATLQQLFNAIANAANDAILAAQTAAQQLVDNAIADGQAFCEVAAQELILQVQSVASFLGDAAQPLIDSLQSLCQNASK